MLLKVKSIFFISNDLNYNKFSDSHIYDYHENKKVRLYDQTTNLIHPLLVIIYNLKFWWIMIVKQNVGIYFFPTAILNEFTWNLKN
jgi:hypothetical protein